MRIGVSARVQAVAAVFRIAQRCIGYPGKVATADLGCFYRAPRTGLQVALNTSLGIMKQVRRFMRWIRIAAVQVEQIDDSQFKLVYHVRLYEMQSLVSAHTRIPWKPGVYDDAYPTQLHPLLQRRLVRNIQA
jgi:hypothetical protein